MNMLTILTTGNISQEVFNGFATGAVSVQEISLIAIIIGAIFVNNVVLSQFLGICPFLGVSSKVNTSLGMGMAVTFVMTLASLMCWVVYQMLILLDLAYMQTVAFILVIAALVQMLELFLKKFIPALHKGLGVYLPLITTNCAVLGVAINNVTDGFSFVESIVSSLGCGT